MKSKLIPIALFIVTAMVVSFYPLVQTRATTPNSGVVSPPAHQSGKIEVVFVLDTTGSMGGLIQAAKEKIWSIASTMASAQSAPEIRMGLVAFRDRGDAYVTNVVDLSGDLDSMYARLMEFRAAGGGDGPESVNQALYDALHKISWSQDPDTYKVVFLVGDAPPHMDYQDDVKYPVTLTVARQRGIVVNTIQCGRNGQTRKPWEHIAQLGDGSYFSVEQTGSAVAIKTPFDKKLADLSHELDETRMYFGSPAMREKQQAKVDATRKLHAASSPESLARRATFNASESGKINMLGENELVDAVSSGRVKLVDIDRDQLPASMRTMEPAAQEKLIDEVAQRRDKIQRELKDLSDERARYLKKKVEAIGGAAESLDAKLYGAVRAQAEKHGLRYGDDAPAY